jgi:hypothetical protein
MLRFRTLLHVTALLATVGAAEACGSATTDDTTLGSSGGTGGTARGGGSATGGSGASAARGGTGGGGGTGGTGVSGGTGGSSVGSGGSVPSSDACPGLSFDEADAGAGVEACRGVSYEAESAPVDLYLMMDRSISLSMLDPETGVSRWDALRNAISDFVSEASDRDLRVGLGFFGRTGGNDDALDCDADYYADPRVEIGKLSDVGGAIIDAMTAVRPGGFTPTAPALEGALRHARAWAEENPGRASAVVLVSDGYPTQCEPRGISQIAALSETAHGMEPYVRTYVIGLAADFNLDSVARAGGTHQAYRADESDPTGSFLAALRNVSNSKLACRYEIPSPPESTMKIDFESVQVTYTSGDGSVEEVPWIADFSACARNPNGGWYYDDPQAPTQILVCPCTCRRFDAGRVDVALGCKPKVGIR